MAAGAGVVGGRVVVGVVVGGVVVVVVGLLVVVVLRRRKFRRPFLVLQALVGFLDVKIRRRAGLRGVSPKRRRPPLRVANLSTVQSER